MSVDRAVQELFDCAGTQFDRAVVEAFAAVLVEDGQLTGRDQDKYRRHQAGTPVGAPRDNRCT
jgi:HD-GYP domain-containing protein (c-di-GMP phosphodiesterase class II)